MTAILTAEWRKLTTTRTFYWMLVGAAAVAALGAFSTTSATSPQPWHMDVPLHDQTLWVLATINGGLFAVIAGARTFTDEFRHRTVAHTYLADPRRVSSALGKAAVAAGVGVLIGLAVVVTSLAIVTAMAGVSGGSVEVHGSDLGAALGLVAGMGLWAVMGAALGALIRHPVAVVVVALLWLLMLENLAAGLLEDAARWLPGQAIHALAQSAEAAGNSFAVAQAATLMAAYGGLTLLLAVIVLRRRDIL